jgi:Zn-dependent peptidase ImmA (M78 family)
MTTTNDELMAIARELPLPVPWDRGRFINAFAELRGRPITLVPTDTVSLSGSPCGLWIARDDDDLIFHEASTSEYHIDQIVCHEIGHMVLGHDRLQPLVSEDGMDLCRAVMPDIGANSVRAVLGRSDFTPEFERDAERFASIVLIAAAERAEQRSPLMRSVFHRST